MIVYFYINPSCSALSMDEFMDLISDCANDNCNIIRFVSTNESFDKNIIKYSIVATGL